MEGDLSKDEELSLVAVMLLECGINVQNDDGSFKTMKEIMDEVDKKFKEKFTEYQESKIQ